MQAACLQTEFGLANYANHQLQKSLELHCFREHLRIPFNALATTIYYLSMCLKFVQSILWSQANKPLFSVINTFTIFFKKHLGLFCLWIKFHWKLHRRTDVMAIWWPLYIPWHHVEAITYFIISYFTIFADV